MARRDYLPTFHHVAERAEIVAVGGKGRECAEFTARAYHIKSMYTNGQHVLAETDAETVFAADE